MIGLIRLFETDVVLCAINRFARQPDRLTSPYADLNLTGKSIVMTNYIVSSGQSSNGITLGQGDSETVFSGGTASGTTINYGASQYVSSGGLVLATTIKSYGYEYLYGGVSVSAVISSGGYEYLYSGTTSGTVISSGGLEFVLSGTAINTIVSSGGVLSAYYSDSVLSGATVLSGGAETVGSGVTATSTYVANGGALFDNGGAVFSDGVKVDSGAIIALSASLNSSYLGSSFTLDAATIQTLDQQLGSSAYDSLFQALAGDRVTYTTADVPGYGTRNVFLEICYLRGTRILSERGEVAVEHLRVGDRLVAEVGGAREMRAIVWTGRAQAVVRRELPDDAAGWPVRIVRDAIAPGMPARDLLVTPEHCLFLDGRFIPARMLVNGRSIIYDRSISTYEYFHIETEQHSVLFAEGLPAESYLDTGNRHSFRQDGSLASIGAPVRSWQSDAAAPLATDRATVEPMFRRIAARAGLAAADASELTSAPDLRLLTPAGRLVRPARAKDGRFTFLLPPGLAEVRLVSRVSRPHDVIGPFVDDRRWLGVRIDGISVKAHDGVRPINVHLANTRLAGWHAIDDAQAGRWTDGSALLPLDLPQVGGFVTLSVDVVAAGPYAMTDAVTVERRALHA